MSYLATVNTAGYLPWDDDPPVFDTTGDAWSYLADQRREQEDSAADTGLTQSTLGEYYSDTVNDLDAKASASADPDTVYGHDVMCTGDGHGCPMTAYNVTEVTDAPA